MSSAPDPNLAGAVAPPLAPPLPVPGSAGEGVAFPAALGPDRPAGPLLRANVRWSLVGNAVFAASGWGMLIVLAKLGSPRMVGQFSLGMAITAPVFLFFNLALRGVQATDARRGYAFGEYLNLRLVTTALALVAVALIAMLSRFGPDLMPVILLVGLAKACESLSDIIYGLLQQHERMNGVAVSLVLRGALAVAALAVGVLVTGSLAWATAGLVLAWGAVLLWHDVPLALRLARASPDKTSVPAPVEHPDPVEHPAPSKDPAPARDAAPANAPSRRRPQLIRRAWRLAWLALPLGCVGMLISVNGNAPRYFIERYLGDHELGIFSAIGYLAVAGHTVIGALAEAAYPRLSKYHAAGQQARFASLFRKLLLIALATGLVGLAVAALAGGPLLRLLYAEPYARHATLFLWLMLAAAMGYASTIVGYSITATRRFAGMVAPYVVITLVTLASCAYFIPRFGLAGAAYAACVSSAATLGLLLLWSSSLHRSGSRAGSGGGGDDGGPTP